MAICVNCHQRISIFANSKDLSDGAVCGRCLKMAGMDWMGGEYDLFSSEQMCSIIQKRKEMLASEFIADEKGEKYISVSSQTRSIMIDNIRYSFDDVEGYHLIDEPMGDVQVTESIERGQIVGGTIGGLLAAHKSRNKHGVKGAIGSYITGRVYGSIGASVGRSIAKHHNNDKCTKLAIIVFLKNLPADPVVIDFISDSVQRSSTEYNRAFVKASRCMQKLDSIIREQQGTINGADSINDEKQPHAETLEELLTECKRLFEIGLINEDEYHKRREFLLFGKEQ